MKIIVTGGHLTPALAVIEELNQGLRIKNQELRILFIGRKYPLEGDPAISPEYNIITRMDIPFVSLTTGRLQRKFTRYTIPSLLKIPLGFFQALWWVLKFKPDIILSFGGYVALPVVLAGWLKGVPIVTHEQTVVSSLANKIIGSLAQKICLSWPASLQYFPKSKVVLTGNPIRKETFQVNKNSQFSILAPSPKRLWRVGDNPQLPIIYITGGSLGSHMINEVVSECLEELLEKYVIIHQCGDSQKYQDFEKLKAQSIKFKAELQKKYFLTKYVEPDDIGYVLQNAALVVSRAGANTVTELAALGKPALFIPLPWAQSNEQFKNAQLLVKTGTAEILPQEELSGKTLQQQIEKMTKNLKNYQKNGEKSKKLIDLSATSKIIEVIHAVSAPREKN